MVLSMLAFKHPVSHPVMVATDEHGLLVHRHSQQMAAALLLGSNPCCRQVLCGVALRPIVIPEKESDVAMMSMILTLLVSLMLLCSISRHRH